MIDFELLKTWGFTHQSRNYVAPQVDDVLVAAPGAGKRIVAVYLEFSTESAGKFWMESDGATQLGSEKYFSANSGAIFDQVLYRCGDNEALTFSSTIAGNHSLGLYYTTLG